MAPAPPPPGPETDFPNHPAANLPLWLSPAFGDYELLEVIARGGMGVVYRARQRSLNRLVAVKMLLAGEFAQPKFIERFRAEAEAVAQLQHPNIVAIHEIGDHDGQPYFTMDLVEGRSLAQVISDLKFQISDVRRAAGWVKTIAEAIEYAHQRGIVHRDLKPSNILIDSLDQPRITDFGLAKRLTDNSDLTQTGQVLGSPSYLPPEQAAGKPVGDTADVYSLGANLYHLLTGRPPFQAETLSALLKQVIETEPVAPGLLNPGIPVDLQTICLKCLEKEPERRYQTAGEVAQELGRFLDGQPIQARPVGAAAQAWKWCLRRPVLAGLTAALVLTFLLGLSGVLWQWRRAVQERRVAQANELLARRHAYAGDMQLVQRSLEEVDLDAARKLLALYRPAHPPPHSQVSNPKSQLTISDPPSPKPDPPSPISDLRSPNPDPRSRSSGEDLRGWEWRYLWAQCRSDEQSTLIHQSGAFLNLALSPDGNVLAVRQSGGNTDLWDWARRRRLGTLTNENGSKALAFIPGSPWLASAHRDGERHEVALWDVTTRRIVRTLPHPLRVVNLTASPDGEWLATFDLEPRLRLWRLSSGELAKDMPGMGPINDLGRVPLFSPDSATLALGEMNGSVRLVNLKTGLVDRTIPAPTEGNGVMAMAFSPDGRFLACGYGLSDGTIRLWDAATGALAASLEGHRAWISKLVFAPDGQTLYSGSADQTIRGWDIVRKKETETGRLQGHTGVLSGLALAHAGATLVSCAFDGSIRVWDLKAKPRRAFHGVLPVRVAPYGAPFTRDSRRLVTASPRDPVIIWEVATAKEIQRLPALGTNHHSVALSPDERLLAVGSLDATIQLWDLVEQRLVRKFRPQSIPIYGLRFWDGGRTLMSHAFVAHRQTSVQRWDVASGAEIPFGRIDVSDSYVLSQSPDHRLLAVPSAGGVTLWNYATGELEASFPSPTVPLMATFSADSRLLAASVAPGAQVWEVGSKRARAALSLPANRIISLAFSPDGRRLVTGGEVGMRLQPALVVWDFAIQRQLLSLQSVGEFTGWTEFSPDGNTLLGLSWTGVADLYRAPTWQEIEAEENP